MRKGYWRFLDNLTLSSDNHVCDMGVLSEWFLPEMHELAFDTQVDRSVNHISDFRPALKMEPACLT